MKIRCLALAASMLLVMFWGRPAKAGDWLPILPQELAMKEEPAAPGAAAIILYYESQDNDVQGSYQVYERTKILTEEGKKYGDVEVLYSGKQFHIGNIKARTIRPDGSIVPFQGKVFDKIVVKGRGLKFLAKTFSLPDVQVGSIIEYRYTETWDNEWLYSTRWILQRELFTKHAKFTLRPGRNWTLRWMTYLVAKDKQVKKGGDGLLTLEMDNIPAFQEEDFMPPSDDLKMRVDFFYSETQEMNPDKFWQNEGKKRSDESENFIGHHRGVEEAVAQIVSATDAPEAKLRKIYARVQQLRNLSRERSKTEKEEKRENLKEPSTSEEALKHGYANGRHINWTFAALARAAGFEAFPLLTASRNLRYFSPNILDPRLFNADLVWVRAAGKEYYLDPATPHCPFGVLPWPETDVYALRLNKREIGFVNVPMPPSTDAVIQRKAALKLTEEGKLAGEITVTFSGMEALRRRLDVSEEDAAGRKKYIEEEAKQWLPAVSTVELTHAPDWDSSDPNLQATFKIEISGWGTTAGRRVLMPVGLIADKERGEFSHANRANPIYFPYAFQTVDQVSIELPAALQVSSVPAPRKVDTNYAKYEFTCQKQPNGVKLVRRFEMDTTYYGVDAYPYLRTFYQYVRADDDQQVVLQAANSAAAKN